MELTFGKVIGASTSRLLGTTRPAFPSFSAHLAVCGDMLDLGFDLPFTDFLPETVLFLFRIEVSLQATSDASLTPSEV